MATVPGQPPDDSGEALEILRRIEPALAGIATRLDKIETEQRRQGETIAELHGRIAGIEGHLSQLPNLLQIAAVVGAIIALGFGLAMVLRTTA